MGSAQSSETAFYIPENPGYTIVDSAADSIRFTVERTLAPCSCGHVASLSSFVNPEGAIMEWHDFGLLEGPGWAANTVGGAHEVYRMGGILGKPAWRRIALDVLDHALEHGFIDFETGFIRGYRETSTNSHCLNFQHNSEWFCPGSMALIGLQLLQFAETLGDDMRVGRMRESAIRCAAWIERNLEPAPNGWFPRRCAPNGSLHIARRAEAEDPLWQTSGDGLFIVQLQTALTQRGLVDYRAAIKNKIDVFVRSGGIFGSVNHDTYDAHESVAYALGFRTLLAAAALLRDEGVRQFAFDICLAGLDRFKLRADRNGVRTTGLLIMEDSWDTAYLWENAEASLALFEAANAVRGASSGLARQYELAGLTILRACARYHFGPYGFLTEGVDWNNHVGQQHHIDGATYGAIQYTEPFLNSQHIAEPTLYYVEHLARRTGDGFRDCEDNLVLRRPVA
ncbi:MAG: hypothetical protein HZB26_02785 [Candidatus Hydrogenedentes bacterium]|nr:hypothetical protein [Candidatus Hydrogenedentota bacterium]